MRNDPVDAKYAGQFRDVQNQLEEASVLRSITSGKRDQAWAAGDVLDEAEDLVDRLKRSKDRLLTPSIRSHLIAAGVLTSGN